MKFFSRKGQTLLEAIVALSILTVGFLGITGLLVRSFSLSRITANETTATYLASEGIEIAKNLLDHDFFSNAQWGTCNGACSQDGTYYADYTTGTSLPGDQALTKVNSCGDVNLPPLGFSSSTGLYSYSAPLPTNKFTRCITIAHTANANGTVEVTVTSKVMWSTGALASQNITLEDHFYRWRFK